MSKYDLEELMFRYLDGEMSSTEVQEFEVLINQNPIYKEDLKKYQDLNEKMNCMSYLKASDGFMAGLNQKIYTLNNKKSWFGKFLDFEFLGFNIRPVLGASLVVLIISGYFFYGTDLTSKNGNKMVIHLNENSSNGNLASAGQDSSTSIQAPDNKQLSKQNVKITSVKGNK
mgnify:CR=1 FL=1